MEEIWKPVPVSGFEDLYEVSNMGRIRVLEHLVSNRVGMMTIHLKIKKTTPNKAGYHRVGLWKNGKGVFSLVHRLVAMAFLDNPDNYKCVNHKDENKSNNCVDNLEWCDHTYNNNYGTHMDKVKGKLSKKVLQYTLDGEFVREWPSAQHIKKELGYVTTAICACCNHKPHHYTAYGFIWRYADES